MNEQEKINAALKAVSFISSGQTIGLGTGSTAYFAIKEIGRMVREGLQIRAIPTSEATRQLAEEWKIPLANINDIETIDITIDGADEFNKKLQLIKGGGGALLREKIVASITRKQVIIADASKQVEKLGAFKVPVEVVPFAAHAVARKLNILNGVATLRVKNGSTYRTDQGNYILDVSFGLIDDPASLAKELDHITGVVEHGLFIDLADYIIVGRGDQVEVITTGDVTFKA
ncbi:ribose-5-phosphate isomerase RpiA [Niabella drilacis]|uniref:Ribose-5-phosphate isomerase A n=1 Tax=Niabella drilacis (strain DSM 25811 / CCM 8410 / CCUG 62505 / LMG 26954 / E90) TaxID=1285928 RepID=A0A1G6NTL3_NIADE|nr:ribose-5-phosphate isomerase RpiA [Niabella drilacis]SDC70694.1 ribose-5-phosphate isomerase [Niabella drilacis]